QTTSRGASKVRVRRTALSVSWVIELSLLLGGSGRVLGGSGQMRIEPVEACVPGVAAGRRPAHGGVERGRIERAWSELGPPPAMDEAGLLEHLEVLGDRREG